MKKEEEDEMKWKPIDDEKGKRAKTPTNQIIVGSRIVANPVPRDSLDQAASAMSAASVDMA